MNLKIIRIRDKQYKGDNPKVNLIRGDNPTFSVVFL